MTTCTQIDQTRPTTGLTHHSSPPTAYRPGTTCFSNIHELQRKYDHLVQKLCALGADVTVTSGSQAQGQAAGR